MVTFLEQGHQFNRSFEPGEDWFCNYTVGQLYEGPDLAPSLRHPVEQPTPGPQSRVRKVGFGHWQFHLIE